MKEFFQRGEGKVNAIAYMLERTEGEAVSLEVFDELKKPGQDAPCMRSIYTIAFRQNVGFSMPVQTFEDKLREIIDKKPKVILEIGCGTGLYSRCFGEKLKAEGVKWIATDHPDKRALYENMKTFCSNIEMTTDPVSLLEGTKPDDQILLAVWPEANSTYILDYIEKFKGRYIIIVGEPGTCCADSVYLDLDAKYKGEEEYLCFYEMMLGGVHERMFVWDKHAPADSDD